MVAHAKAVANEFLRLASEAGQGIDPLQMQKLLYLAQGWCLGLTGEKLFRESIEAWQYGPVVPEIYHALKHYGDRPIKKPLVTFDEERGDVVPASYQFDDYLKEVIKNVWGAYGGMSGPQLVRLTHERGAPWDKARRASRDEENARIATLDMLAWFDGEAERARGVNDGNGTS
ncbi:hypothetical protein STVA_07000 [Allostella vacuolata]|nr:hypothetical protein STVA_07000 [Stella vacuolata]